MRVKFTVASVVLSAVVTVLALSPTTAFGAGPVQAHCGDTITTNAYLAGDLTCTGNGLVLVGNVRLDLRGHNLNGNSASYGITIRGSSSSPTIRNGQISGWFTGVGDEVGDGELPVYAQTVTIERVTFSKNDSGVRVGTYTFDDDADTAAFNVSRSRFTDNNYGVYVSATGDAVIHDSTFLRNANAVTADRGTLGLRKNVMVGGQWAVTCTSAHCDLRGNRVVDNGGGFLGLGDGHAALTANLISGGTIGVILASGTDNRVTRNIFTNDHTAVEAWGASGTVSTNLFAKNGDGYTTDGQSLDPTSLITLAGNYFTHNRNGIFTEESGTALQRNTSVKNVRWGIYAPLGTDLGGNSAHGNGQSPQCRGVSC